MRAALALGTALAVCCVVLEAAPAETDEASLTDLMETVQNLARRVEEMERERAEDQRRIRELEETLETVRIAAARGADEGPQARESRSVDARLDSLRRPHAVQAHSILGGAAPCSRCWKGSVRWLIAAASPYSHNSGWGSPLVHAGCDVLISRS